MPRPPYIRCTFTRANGRPCAARALPGSSFCLFHDPAHAETLAAGRRSGGAASRRPSRHQLAVLLGELLIQALEGSNPCDTGRLQTVASLARVTLNPNGGPAEKARIRKVKKCLKTSGTGR
jgi:hypothetical protein